MIVSALQDAATLDYQARIAVRSSSRSRRTPVTSPIFPSSGACEPGLDGGRFTPSICTAINTPRDEANRTQITPLPL